MDLPKIEKGMAVLADHIDKITREIRSNQIVAMVGGSFMRAPGGTSLTVVPQILGSAAAATTNCPFEVTNASAGTILNVKIKQGQIANRWPEGMGLGYPDYLLEISESCYIYCKMVFIENDVVLRSETSAISFLQSSQIQESTINDLYVLVATVVVESGAIKTIQNVCQTITPNACDLKWS